MSCCALLREASRLAAAEPFRFAQGDSVRKSYGEWVLEGKGVDGMRKRRGVIILVLAALGVGFIVNTVVQQQDGELRGIPSLQTLAQQSGGLMQGAQGADVQAYRERNERGDCWVDHTIQFQASIGGPGAIGRGGNDFNHQLKVLRKWTESNCESLIREDSQFVLGAYNDPVRVKVKTYGNGLPKWMLGLTVILSIIVPLQGVWGLRDAVDTSAAKQYSILCGRHKMCHRPLPMIRSSS